MEAPRKGRFQNLKNKTFKILRRRRRRAAHDKKTGVHSTGGNENSPPPLPPMSAYSDDISEDSELSSTTYPSCEKTVDLPKPQEDESANTSEKELCPAVVDITSANSKKRLADMSTEGHKRLTVLLQPRDALGRDYRMLADKMGYSNNDIKFLGSTNEPVKELMKEYEKGDRKIVELISLLRDMERWDVVEDLQKYLDETPTPEEIRKRREQAQGKNDELKTSRKSYHAFICHARDDEEFVNKLVKKLENAPYNLHLCLSERDFIPGGSIYDTTAVAIEQRCEKFVVVLSRNFDNSEGSHFESHIAMSLSPGAKQKRLIPILIEEGYRSNIPRTLSHITYLDWLRQDEKYFWDSLAGALGWKRK